MPYFIITVLFVTAFEKTTTVRLSMSPPELQFIIIYVCINKVI